MTYCERFCEIFILHQDLSLLFEHFHSVQWSFSQIAQCFFVLFFEATMRPKVYPRFDGPLLPIVCGLGVSGTPGDYTILVGILSL